MASALREGVMEPRVDKYVERLDKMLAKYGSKLSILEKHCPGAPYFRNDKQPTVGLPVVSGKRQSWCPCCLKFMGLSTRSECPCYYYDNAYMVAIDKVKAYKEERELKCHQHKQ
jgi:hypothetical protein